jgi:hypothetical protein
MMQQGQSLSCRRAPWHHPLSICNLCDEIRNLVKFLLCSKDFNIHKYFSNPKYVLVESLDSNFTLLKDAYEESKKIFEIKILSWYGSITLLIKNISPNIYLLCFGHNEDFFFPLFNINRQTNKYWYEWYIYSLML